MLLAGGAAVLLVTSQIANDDWSAYLTTRQLNNKQSPTVCAALSQSAFNISTFTSASTTQVKYVHQKSKEEV